jgi:hypothetical protein
MEDLESFVDPATSGDPESTLRWTSKSVSKLAQELQNIGHRICAKTVYNLLQSMDYSKRIALELEERK